MSGGYEKAALALRRLDAADRDWLLDQLDAEDRTRVQHALVQAAAETGGETAAERNAKPGPAAAKAARVTDADMEALMNADPQDVAALLANEPDWVVAVLMCETVWPWGAAFLQGLESERIENLAQLAPRLASSVRPRVKKAVVGACARRLRDVAPEPATVSAFDEMVATMQREVENASWPERTE